jgi:hypothetical protein
MPITTPLLAIAGGCTLLVVLLCILVVRARGIARRRRALLATRRTRFHAVIDPRVADLGRAAFEVVEVEVETAQVVDTITIPAPPPPRPNMHVRMHSLQRETPPRRLARGSTPAIVYPAHISTGCASDWDVPTAPSVTAQLRAYRR